jgi:DeoR/GlpR family transcriptional regulator of sugar metabolism
MLAIERRNIIMEIVQNDKRVLVVDLSKKFEVTEETIRRDLEKLENQGFLKRSYGGAVLKENTNIDIPLNIRESSNIKGKEAIGRRIAELIDDGDSIFLDSSSTAFYVAKNIKEKKRLTIITNSVKIILELSGIKDSEIISTGGMLRANSLSLVGHLAENVIQGYNVDKAIISCKGIDKVKGITDSNDMEAEIKRAMMASADKVFLVADHGKFGKISFTKIAGLDKVNSIVTDEKLPEEWEEKIESTEIQLYYGKE